MPLNPAPFLDHGILGGFVLVLIIGLVMGFRLVNRLIDTLQSNSREQIAALMSVEKDVKDSIDKAESRHEETLAAYLRSTALVAETREALSKWSERCKGLCGHLIGDNNAA